MKNLIKLIACCLSLSAISSSSYASNELTASCAKKLSTVFRARAPMEQIREHSVRKDEAFIRLLSIVYAVESRYQADAVSPAGALGIGQMLPSTAREAAKELGDLAPTNADLFKLSVNIRLSSHYLRKVLTNNRENVILALVAYNAGGKWAARLRSGQKVPRETAQYIVSIMYLTKEYCS